MSSKYLKSLQPLLKQTSFSAQEARDHKIPTRMLSHFCKTGLIERISSGYYKSVNTHISYHDELLSIAQSISNGVICLISALCYYELTDQMMREYWIAIPNNQRKVVRPNTRVIRMRNMTLGVEEFKESKIFDQERTVVDAFRFLDQEIAIKALKFYLRKPGCKIDKLLNYAKILRVQITPYLIALTT